MNEEKLTLFTNDSMMCLLAVLQFKKVEKFKQGGSNVEVYMYGLHQTILNLDKTNFTSKYISSPKEKNLNQ